VHLQFSNAEKNTELSKKRHVEGQKIKKKKKKNQRTLEKLDGVMDVDQRNNTK